MTLSPTGSVISARRTTGRSAWGVVRAYLELGKARLSALVLFSTAVGFVLASGGALDRLRLVLTLAGTGLAALGANALNQWREARPDALMNRTAGRPLPTRRLTGRAALYFGLTAGLSGPTLLVASVDPLAGLLAFAALTIYVWLYTPLKVRTPANTLVGAVVGAVPPLIGLTGACGRLELGAWLLAGILFLWQIPHFLALAWLYRDDYARGGFWMLPRADATGSLTGCAAVVYALVLLQATLVPTLTGLTGWWYGAGAVGLGVGLLAAAVTLERQRTDFAARRLFLASVVYLPVLLGLMLLDMHPRV